jgi:hypothetical protein
VTYTATLNGGDQEVVLPNGLRYQGSAQVVLSDDWYAQLSAHAVSALLSTASLGGTATYQVTIAGGLHGVALPDGLCYKAADVVTLSDEQYSVITPAAVAALFSSVSVKVA